MDNFKGKGIDVRLIEAQNEIKKLKSQIVELWAGMSYAAAEVHQSKVDLAGAAELLEETDRRLMACMDTATEAGMAEADALDIIAARTMMGQQIAHMRQYHLFWDATHLIQDKTVPRHSFTVTFHPAGATGVVGSGVTVEKATDDAYQQACKAYTIVPIGSEGEED